MRMYRFGEPSCRNGEIFLASFELVYSGYISIPSSCSYQVQNPDNHSEIRSWQWIAALFPPTLLRGDFCGPGYHTTFPVSATFVHPGEWNLCSITFCREIDKGFRGW